LEAVPLAVADTRPAMVRVLSIPYTLAIYLMMGGVLLALFTHNIFYGLVVVPLWGLAREAIKYEPNAARIVGLWIETSAAYVDARRWGGASPASFPVRPGRHPRGIADA
jgi:type IV secretion system protein VirB3